MPETKLTGKGGAGRGQGRKTGVPNRPKQNTVLLGIAEMIRQAILDENWTAMREQVNILMTLSRFLPETSEPSAEK